MKLNGTTNVYNRHIPLNVFPHPSTSNCISSVRTWRADFAKSYHLSWMIKTQGTGKHTYIVLKNWVTYGKLIGYWKRFPIVNAICPMKPYHTLGYSTIYVTKETIMATIKKIMISSGEIQYNWWKAGNIMLYKDYLHILTSCSYDWCN